MNNPLDEIPPNNIIAEQQVLSSILLNRDTMMNLIADIEDEYFYHHIHRDIFSTIKKFRTTDQSIIAKHVPDSEMAIADLLELGAFRDCSSSVDELRDSYLRREVRSELIRSLLCVSRNFELPVTDQINSIYDKLFQLGHKGQKFIPQLIGDMLPQFFVDIENQYKNGNTVRSILTGVSSIDEHLFIEPGDLVVIGARPSMGKSTLASCISRYNGIRRCKSVAYFSVEMGGRTQVKRDMFAEAGISLFAFNKGLLPKRDYPKLSLASGPVSNAKIWIDSEPSITPMKIQSKCNYIKSKTGLDLIIVDYLQICKSDKRFNDKRLMIEDITQSLKDIAKYFDVPVIALSQLTRDVDKRTDKRPMKSDLIESGSIEAIADIILFIYRDEVYFHDSKDVNIAEIICAKQRNGASEFRVKVFFDKETMNFREISKDEPTGFEDNGTERY